jgi:hypothetical protein
LPLGLGLTRRTPSVLPSCPASQVNCSGGLLDPASMRFLQELLPNSRMLKLRPVAAALRSPGADCVLDMGPVLGYFEFERGFELSLCILLGYYLVTHVSTFAAMLVVARRERR